MFSCFNKKIFLDVLGSIDVVVLEKKLILNVLGYINV